MKKKGKEIAQEIGPPAAAVIITWVLPLSACIGNYRTTSRFGKNQMCVLYISRVWIS